MFCFCPETVVYVFNSFAKCYVNYQVVYYKNTWAAKHLTDVKVLQRWIKCIHVMRAICVASALINWTQRPYWPLRSKNTHITMNLKRYCSWVWLCLAISQTGALPFLLCICVAEPSVVKVSQSCTLCFYFCCKWNDTSYVTEWLERWSAQLLSAIGKCGISAKVCRCHLWLVDIHLCCGWCFDFCYP